MKLLGEVKQGDFGASSVKETLGSYDGRVDNGIRTMLLACKMHIYDNRYVDMQKKRLKAREEGEAVLLDDQVLVVDAKGCSRVIGLSSGKPREKDTAGKILVQGKCMFHLFM